MATVVVHIVTIVRAATKHVVASMVNIIAGHPQNLVEKVLADALRELISNLISRSRLMNPGVP